MKFENVTTYRALKDVDSMCEKGRRRRGVIRIVRVFQRIEGPIGKFENLREGTRDST